MMKIKFIKTTLLNSSLFVRSFKYFTFIMNTTYKYSPTNGFLLELRCSVFLLTFKMAHLCYLTS